VDKFVDKSFNRVLMESVQMRAGLQAFDTSVAAPCAKHAVVATETLANKPPVAAKVWSFGVDLSDRWGRLVAAFCEVALADCVVSAAMIPASRARQ
jgi:hypothetical protein